MINFDELRIKESELLGKEQWNGLLDDTRRFFQGNVGLGVNAPKAKLHVGGDVKIEGNLHLDEKLEVGGGAKIGGSLHLKDKLGIGVTNPLCALSLGRSLGRVKLALYQSANSKSYYGMGVTSGHFYFNIGNPKAKYAFLDRSGSKSQEIFTIKGNGNVGIGATNPSHALHVVHSSARNGGASAGLKIENTGSKHNWWAIYTANGSGQLELYHKGTIKGRFKPHNGAYEQGSDYRLKRDIRSLSSVMSKVKLLNPTTYTFKDDDYPTNPSLGFIAQEVESLFPELVGSAGEQEDVKTLDYSGFGVLAIKAIQEQQDIIEHLIERIDGLERKVLPPNH